MADIEEGNFVFLFAEKRRILEAVPEDEPVNSNVSDYVADGKRKRLLSPTRNDPLSGNNEAKNYVEILKQNEAERQEVEAKKKKEEHDKKEKERKSERRRWDMPTPEHSSGDERRKESSSWEEPMQAIPSTPGRQGSRWDATPVSETPGRSRSRWDSTPIGETPSRSRSRWDATPVNFDPSATPDRGMEKFGFSTNPSDFFPRNIAATPDQLGAIRMEKEYESRNRPLSDAELDSLLPQEGYMILPVPSNYVPVQTPSRKLMATPLPGDSLFSNSGGLAPLGRPDDDLPFTKAEDYQFFGKLLEPINEDDMTIEEAKERKLLKLLLRIKNGTPQMRRIALRQLTEKARDFGPELLFDHLLPLLMSPTLDEQERHLLVKVIDRMLFKLDSLVRPYVHKILVVVEPMLVDADFYARVEGREVLANLSKAAGLASMIAALRPDIDHADEFVRNATARALAVVASALGIHSLLPFYKAACASKKTWQARHSGLKAIQQTAILMGRGILPHLKGLVLCAQEALGDEQHKVRTMAALTLSALAEASAPFGIEAFDGALKPLYHSLRHQRGKPLAATIKAIGQIIPLMDAEYAAYYTKEIMPILVREFQTPDEEMKKIVLKTVRQCVASKGVEAAFVRSEVLPDFFRHLWQRRMALDRRNYRALVDTTAALATKAGVGVIMERLVPFLKDDSEPFRRMTVEAIDLIVGRHGSSEISDRLEEQLIDGLMYVFQDHGPEENPLPVLRGIGTVISSLGARFQPYVQAISSLILWRLGNRSARVRQLAADLVSRVAASMVSCGEESKLSVVSTALYENLGEEYPDVLASILGALKSIVQVIGMARMNPPVKELLPRLTPILRNRHERVQENCIELVGRVADRAPEAVSAKEWMRVCFELLDMLKAHRKSVRRAAIQTFGFIAKAIGPQDVLSTLLNNLKVQERQNRLCTTIAIAIVAETCGPFTVLPALMNEYRVPELNVQNGVLKSLSFMFEYIGEMGRDYIYAVTPLLEDALVDRDLVHRQTASVALRHMALGVVGFGCEDALIHLLNHLFPNAFERSPHVILSIIESFDALRLAVGPGTLLLYLVQGLFHPARRVRDIYWKLYNNLYIGAEQALVQFYPDVEDTSDRQFHRHILDIVL